MSIARLAVALLVGSSLSAVVHAAPAKPVYGPWGVDYASMDKGVKPGDDFFGYAEGTWLKTTPIAPDKASAGYNSDLPDLAERDVRQIVEDAQKNPTTPIAKQIGDFYAAWMDQAGIEARGLKPVRPYLAQIAAIDTRAQLVQLMAEPGAAGSADARLLSAPRRQIRCDPQGLSRLHHPHPDARGHPRCRRQGRCDHRARDAAVAGPVDSRAPPRSAGDL